MSPLSTSSSDGAADPGRAPHARDGASPYRLAARLLLFLAPVLAFVAASEVVFAMTGESYSMATVQGIEAEHGGATLFQRSLLAEELRRYKWTEARARQPEILVLGSSTAMQIRGADFGPWEGRTYNVGGMIHEAHQLREFGARLDAFPRLRLLVLGVDPWWWKPHLPPHRDASLATIEAGPEAALSWRAHLRALRRVVRAILRQPGVFRVVRRDEAAPYTGVGLGGRRGSGFRGTDGSHRYGDYVRGQADGSFRPNVAEHLAGARACAGFFVCDPAPSQALLDHLRALLDAARDRGVLVVGYAPPLHPALVDALNASAKHGPYLREARERVGRLFRARGLPWLDATDAREAGFGADAYYYDGLHASETVLAWVMSRLLDAPQVAAAAPGLDGRFAAALLASPSTTPASLHLPVGRRP